MMDLVKELLLTIHLIAGYPVPDTLPTIQVIPDEVLQRKVCGQPCWVRAVYEPEHGILLAASVNVDGDAYGRSILLHELVHHMQRVSGRFEAAANPCERRSAEEYEAYEIQNRYLATRHDPRRIPLRLLSSACE